MGQVYVSGGDGRDLPQENPQGQHISWKSGDEEERIGAR